jgi:hypothetical protein
MNPHSISSYGGPFFDAKAVKDPTTQLAAAFADRMFEDVAQLTRASGFTWFSFITTLTAAVTTLSAANVAVASFFGSGSAQKPTVSKTATGTYTLTWPSTFDDALVGVAGMDGVAETQSVAFTFASGLNNMGATNGYARVTAIASNVVTVKVYDTTDALSDLGGTATISGYLR